MNYVNDRFCELVQLPRNRQAILAMKKDVDDFLPSFCDSPAKLSRWGHHYFCDDDGGRLIFDLNSPHSHRCEICGWRVGHLLSQPGCGFGSGFGCGIQGHR